MVTFGIVFGRHEVPLASRWTLQKVTRHHQPRSDLLHRLGSFKKLKIHQLELVNTFWTSTRKCRLFSLWHLVSNNLTLDPSCRFYPCLMLVEPFSSSLAIRSKNLTYFGHLRHHHHKYQSWNLLHRLQSSHLGQSRLAPKENSKWHATWRVKVPAKVMQLQQDSKTSVSGFTWNWWILMAKYYSKHYLARQLAPHR